MEPIPALTIDLRYGPGTPQDAIRRNARRHQPRLTQNLASLGAVGPYVPRPGPGAQPVIVAGHITRADTTTHHLEQYLAPHKQKPGRELPFFGPDGTVSRTGAQAFAARAQGDPHQFRFSVSFQGSPPFLPMRPYIEALLWRVQQDLQRPLDWVAQVHTDTANLHAHVVLRGRDTAGQDLYIRNGYLRQGLTHQAQTLATQFLGRIAGMDLAPTRQPEMPRGVQARGVER